MTKEAAMIKYPSVVSRETVRIALMIDALNDVEGKSADILNAYAQAPVTENFWTMLGSEFGSNACKSAMIVVQYIEKTHKLWMDLPKTIKETKAIGEKNAKTYIGKMS